MLEWDNDAMTPGKTNNDAAAMMNGHGGSADCMPGDVDVAKCGMQLTWSLREGFTVTEKHRFLKSPSLADEFCISDISVLIFIYCLKCESAGCFQPGEAFSMIVKTLKTTRRFVASSSV